MFSVIGKRGVFFEVQTESLRVFNRASALKVYIHSNVKMSVFWDVACVVWQILTLW
jgi:hypothetical protein